MVRKIGIDLGTTNLLICLDNKGVIVDEPSVITVDASSKKCIAAGLDAREMLGRTPKNMLCIRPLKDGVVADFEATDMMLNYFLKKCELKGMFKKNIILICHPTKITSVEKNAIRDCAYRAGAKKVYLEEEPKVAAVGTLKRPPPGATTPSRAASASLTGSGTWRRTSRRRPAVPRPTRARCTRPSRRCPTTSRP